MIEIKLIPFKYRTKKDGSIPIYLRFTKYKTVKYIYTNEDCSFEQFKEWDSINEKIDSKKPINKDLNQKIIAFKAQYQNFYENELSKTERESIEISELLDKVNPKSNIKKIAISSNVYSLIDLKIQEINKINGSIKTIDQYKDCKRTIHNYTKKQNLNISEINPEWLARFEVYQKDTCKPNSISVRMRALRTIFNLAINEGVIDSSKYPFSKNNDSSKYSISSLSIKGSHKAISIEEFKKIENLDCKLYPKLEFSKELFIFSYYTGGMNFIDIMNLKWNNFTINRIEYTRSKTGQNFDIPILEPIKGLIKKYKSLAISDYVFPILKRNNMTKMQIHNRHQKMLGKFNNDLKEIASICAIDTNVTTYVARHSMASNLFILGYPLEDIQKLMGHDSVTTTKKYIDGINSVKIDEGFSLLVQN